MIKRLWRRIWATYPSISQIEWMMEIYDVKFGDVIRASTILDDAGINATKVLPGLALTTQISGINIIAVAGMMIEQKQIMEGMTK